VDEDPVTPCLEPLGLAQVREPSPGQHEGVLQRVLGQARVAQDPVRDGVERVAHLVHQDRERLAVAPPGLLDQVRVHVASGRPAGRSGASTHYDGRLIGKRSVERGTGLPRDGRPVGTWDD
jgi:hypothetical protein